MWDTAQAIGTEHATSRDGAAANTHPATRRTYILRSRALPLLQTAHVRDHPHRNPLLG